MRNNKARAVYRRSGGNSVNVDDLRKDGSLFYDDCILVGTSEPIGFHRIEERIVIDEMNIVDELELTDIRYLFDEEIDGSAYAGGEGFSHGSYGFFLKSTGGVLNWAVMSLESNPFIKVEIGSGSVRFLSTSGEAWVVPNDDIRHVLIERNNSPQFKPV
jgi:hypothetical protein